MNTSPYADMKSRAAWDFMGFVLIASMDSLLLSSCSGLADLELHPAGIPCYLHVELVAAEELAQLVVGV